MYIRTAEGILERVQRGDALSSSYHRLLTGVLDQLIATGVIPALDTDYAVLLWLTIFDEGVFVGLHWPGGWSPMKQATAWVCPCLLS